MLRAAGANSDAILAALEMVDEATGELRAEVARLQAADADRRRKKTKQKQEERIVSREVEETVSRLSRDTDGDDVGDNDATVAVSGSAPPPPKRYNQTPTTPPSVSVEARARIWFSEEFYPDWPNKVGRAAAERAGVALYRKRRGDMTAVIAGRDRYIREKPADRPWLNPATFLNQERFDDRPAAPPARAGPPPRSSDGQTNVLRRISEARHAQQRHDDQQDGTETSATDARTLSSGQQVDERGRDQWDGPQLNLVALGSDYR